MPAIITDKIKRQFAQQVFDQNQGKLLGTPITISILVLVILKFGKRTITLM